MTILQRRKGGKYILRWTDPMTGRKLVETTEFVVLTKAKEQALDKSKELLRVRTAAPGDGRMTCQELLRYYEERYLPLQEGKRQEDVDRLCLDVWRAVLPPLTAVDGLEKHVLLEYIQRRQRGELKVPGRSLRPCGARAVAVDLEWLRRVVNIAIADDKRIGKNPVKLVEIPKTMRPRQPDASWSRYELLRPHCEDVGSQNIFGGFMDLAVGLGWRVSALTCLHVSDIDRRPRPDAPNGQILKREEFDKMGFEQYVPISDWLAPRIDELLRRRKALQVDSPWLFPKPTKPETPWDRSYPKERQLVAERKAGIEPIEGGDFHPWRRMWANLRKHLPLKDVAYAGCWDEQTLLRHYQKSDGQTVLAVMNAGLPS